MDKIGYFDLDMWVEVTKNTYFVFGNILIILVVIILLIPKTKIKKWIPPLALATCVSFNFHLLAIHKFINSPSSFNDTIIGIGALPPGYFVGNLSYSFTVGNEQHKPFLYLYTAKIMAVPDWSSSVNKLNRSVFKEFIEHSKKPVYTVIESGQLRELMQIYPEAKVVYSNLKYRDVETYIDYRGKGGPYSPSQKGILVVLLNKIEEDVWLDI